MGEYPHISGDLPNGYLFLPASEYASTDSTNLTLTRIAQRNWALARTATGAETYNVVFSVPVPWRLTASTGFQISSIDVMYQITTTALTTHTFVLSTRTFANNTANALANTTTTGTLKTATQTQPYLTNIVVSSPAYQNTAAVETLFELQAVMGNNGVYRLYGIGVNFTAVAV